MGELRDGERMRVPLIAMRPAENSALQMSR